MSVPESHHWTLVWSWGLGVCTFMILSEKNPCDCSQWKKKKKWSRPTLLFASIDRRNLNIVWEKAYLEKMEQEDKYFINLVSVLEFIACGYKTQYRKIPDQEGASHIFWERMAGICSFCKLFLCAISNILSPCKIETFREVSPVVSRVPLNCHNFL